MKTLCLLSGGLDSTTALYWAMKNSNYVETLSFNYKSKHNDAEYAYAKQICDDLNIKNTRLDLDFVGDLFKSDLLKTGGDIPEGHYADESMKSTVVPFRNGIMLSIAIGYAESIGLDAVVIGNHFGDHAIYPDCRKDFITAMKLASSLGTYKQIDILSPFVAMSKSDIVKIGVELGVPFINTFSCYVGEEKACGLCGTCCERIISFYENGLKDPIEYKNSWDEVLRKALDEQKHFEKTKNDL